ncbi:MAG: UDP-2,3-diacylglucosamine hydrolase [Saprospiraceae bacterium]|nr:MAG: UDP-2,3-diacylglucosamine hydrolase [Saprospiraceae bacterium]
MSTNKKTYFASDFHLGIDAKTSSVERERQIVRWLAMVSKDAEAIYLAGDLFDFWFEYKRVIPKGYVRLLGKLAELSDQGISLYFFTGNHDMWMFRYFEEELGIPTYRQPIVREIHGKTFFIGHGDGLGPGDYGYKFIKKIFANPVCQWLFERLHPNFGIWLANFWSGKSRAVNAELPVFQGEEGEWLISYANQKLDTLNADYFIFGHRHLPIDYLLKNGRSRYINLGEWMNFNSYAVFDGSEVQLKFFENDQGIICGNMQQANQHREPSSKE